MVMEELTFWFVRLAFQSTRQQPKAFAFLRANFVRYQHSPIVRKRNQTLIEQRIDVRGKQETVFGVKALLVRAYCPWFNVRSTKDSRYSAARNSTHVAPTPSNVGTKPS